MVLTIILRMRVDKNVWSTNEICRLVTWRSANKHASFIRASDIPGLTVNTICNERVSLLSIDYIYACTQNLKKSINCVKFEARVKYDGPRYKTVIVDSSTSI